MSRYAELMDYIKYNKKISDADIWQIVMLEDIAKSLAIIADNTTAIKNSMHNEYGD